MTATVEMFEWQGSPHEHDRICGLGWASFLLHTVSSGCESCSQDEPFGPGLGAGPQVITCQPQQPSDRNAAVGVGQDSPEDAAVVRLVHRRISRPLDGRVKHSLRAFR
jgi:hypothetical protein